VPHTLFITGASGFVGRTIVEHALSLGHEVNALVHRAPPPSDGRVRSVEGDLFDAATMIDPMRGCDVVIHLVGIIRERRSAGITFERIHVDGTRSVVGAASAAGVTRFIHMSALGARPDAPARYHRTKFEAEQIVRQSAPRWTIFRPSLIYGPGGEFWEMEAAWARGTVAPFLFMPYFGRGLFGHRGGGRLQPIHVQDVARAFLDAIALPRTIGKTYDLGGAEALTWPQLHRLCAQALVGRQRWVMPIPAWKAKLLTYLIPAALLPFNRDQVTMSLEDNTCDLEAFTADFGWTPLGMRAKLRG